MSDAPTPGGNLPARRLSTHELEAVIRRAVELQAARDGEGADDGITESEAIGIGRELGLAPEVVRRAIADVRSRPVEERGVLAGVMGPGVVRAVRSIRRPAAPLGLFLEEYLLRCEYMAVQRRLPDRTRYVRATGVAAAFGRAFGRMGVRYPALDLQQLDVAVSAVDGETALVELTVDMGTARAGLAAGGVLGGSGAGAAAGVSAWVATAAPELALVGVPVLLAMGLGTRFLYRYVLSSTQEKLESFLDRLEHGELKVPPKRGGGQGKVTIFGG